jgi:hypothetical protein
MAATLEALPMPSPAQESRILSSEEGRPTLPFKQKTIATSIAYPSWEPFQSNVDSARFFRYKVHSLTIGN